MLRGLLAPLTLACGDATGPPATAGWLELEPGAILPTRPGDILRLRTTVRDADGAQAPSPVEWRTSDAAVVTLTSGGLLTAVDAGCTDRSATPTGRSSRRLRGTSSRSTPGANTTGSSGRRARCSKPPTDRGSSSTCTVTATRSRGSSRATSSGRAGNPLRPGLLDPRPGKGSLRPRRLLHRGSRIAGGKHRRRHPARASRSRVARHRRPPRRIRDGARGGFRPPPGHALRNSNSLIPLVRHGAKVGS